MQHRARPPFFILSITLGALLVIVLGGSAFGYYYFTRELASTTSSFANQLKNRDADLAAARNENTVLQNALKNQIALNTTYGQQVTDISNTVSELSKWSQLDPQLLAKYSKVYFLNENYIPTKLATITPEYTFEKSRTYKFEADALLFLTNMLNDASSSGSGLEVVSAYRSFGEQSALKTEYKTTYGAGANRFSADQGYSEHQLGTTADFTTPTIGASFSGFDKTAAYQWLTQNAYKYGFILSYPKGNSYYVYEPWHWRFVGIKLATMLHAENEHFYDLDQHQINPYLITIFDPAGT